MSGIDVRAHYALFHRTAAEKNFEPGQWLDSGIRGDSPETCARVWRTFAKAKTDWQDTECRLVPIEDRGAPAQDDDDDDVCGLEGIDPQMLLAMEKLRHDLEHAGGKGEVWACNAGTHDLFFGGATEMLGLPMVVRPWVPTGKVVIASLVDLDDLIKTHPLTDGVA